MKLQKMQVMLLEKLEGHLWEEYVRAVHAKKSGKQSMLSWDAQLVEVPLSKECRENLDFMIKSMHEEYLTLLQLVASLGYESFVQEDLSDEKKMVRIHRIFSRSFFKRMMKKGESK